MSTDSMSTTYLFAKGGHMKTLKNAGNILYLRFRFLNKNTFVDQFEIIREKTFKAGPTQALFFAKFIRKS